MALAFATTFSLTTNVLATYHISAYLQPSATDIEIILFWLGWALLFTTAVILIRVGITKVLGKTQAMDLTKLHNKARSHLIQMCSH